MTVANSNALDEAMCRPVLFQDYHGDALTLKHFVMLDTNTGDYLNIQWVRLTDLTRYIKTHGNIINMSFGAHILRYRLVSYEF